MNVLNRWKFPLFVSILLSLLFTHCFENRAFVDVDIKAAKKTWFKIYWAEEGGLYSEKNMSRVRINPAQEHYRFFLTDLRKNQKLRIDPGQYKGETTFKKIVLNQNGLQTIQFESEKDFARLIPLFQVADFGMTAEGFTVQSTGIDPQFEYTLELKKVPRPYFLQIIRIAAIFAAVFFFFYFTENFRDENQFIPLLFAAIFILVVVMASLSARNVHPDEYVHLSASEYYMSNWLPPAVDDPSIRHTYSVYGVSRLNSREISYFFSGKLAQLAAPLKLPGYLNLRIFNVLLFALILLYVFRHQQARIVAIPFLFSPQLWYVFSYCDSDAFALAIAFFVGCQVVLPDSMLQVYLRTEKNNVFRLLSLGFLCAMLFLLKKNYYFFIVFVFLYICGKFLFYKEWQDKTLIFKRFALIILIGMCFTGIRVSADYAVNGMDRSEKIAELREELARPLYKPSTPLEKKHSFLYRKARGDSLAVIIKIDRWFEKTFRSAFGVYGYSTVSASGVYYDVVRWASTSFLAFLALSIFVRGGIQGNLLLLLFLSCSGGLIAASLWHSWTADFQPQGRYLFPVIPMLGILAWHTYRLMPASISRLFLVAMFMLSVYSFIYVGLLHIPKVIFAGLS